MGWIFSKHVTQNFLGQWINISKGHSLQVKDVQPESFHHKIKTKRNFYGVLSFSVALWMILGLDLCFQPHLVECLTIGEAACIQFFGQEIVENWGNYVTLWPFSSLVWFCWILLQVRQLWTSSFPSPPLDPGSHAQLWPIHLSVQFDLPCQWGQWQRQEQQGHFLCPRHGGSQLELFSAAIARRTGLGELLEEATCHSGMHVHKHQ